MMSEDRIVDQFHFDRDLPELRFCSEYQKPNSHLIKVGENEFTEKQGRRASVTMLVEKIRNEVDAWRDQNYPGASLTTQHLLHFWFDESHFEKDEPWQFYFCQREAIETYIYLFEIKGIRDVEPLVRAYYSSKSLLPETDLIFDSQSNGGRMLSRIGFDNNISAQYQLPPEEVPRFAFKMATGTGKAVVMALSVTWSYFHKRYENNSPLTQNFLIIAPNLIVFERLQKDFAGNSIFHELPFIPPEWKDDFNLKPILRGERTPYGHQGNLFLTNIQQIYERQTESTPINPLQTLLGPKPKADIDLNQQSMLDVVKNLDSLMIMNDEAHHVHDEELAWYKAILNIHAEIKQHSGKGLASWLDFSATPKDQNGTYFPWIIVDYPLAQAVEDHIVKTPLVVHQIDKADPEDTPKLNAAIQYNDWIQIAIRRWKDHQKAYSVVKQNPILFVMAENTAAADQIAARLEEDPVFKNKVLTIHINMQGKDKGQIRKQDLEKARQIAREVDRGKSNIRAIVSVLMLREGWDVKNVTLILGLRPFTSKAEILPEQTIGRGLRKMSRISPDETQILEIIGTNAFENFVRELEKEGVGIITTKKTPEPPVHIFPVDEKIEYDVIIPRTSETHKREFKNFDLLEPNKLEPIIKNIPLNIDNQIRIETRHAPLGIVVKKDIIRINKVPFNIIITSLTNCIMKNTKLVGCFYLLYPKLKEYVFNYCFGEIVGLDEESLTLILNNSSVQQELIDYFTQLINELTTETREFKVEKLPIKLSKTKTFIWRQKRLPCKKTIFNLVPIYNHFEGQFAQFLDASEDILRFAKLAEWFTEFRVDYLNHKKASSYYYPDFIAVQRDLSGNEINWVIETKGWEQEDVALKDRAIEQWCERVTTKTGSNWKYLKVMQKDFEKENWICFVDLVGKIVSNYRLINHS